MGERGLGTLLVMGSEGNLGIYNGCRLSRFYSYAFTAVLQTLCIVDDSYCFYPFDDYVDWGKLSACCSGEYSCVFELKVSAFLYIMKVGFKIRLFLFYEKYFGRGVYSLIYFIDCCLIIHIGHLIIYQPD